VATSSSVTVNRCSPNPCYNGGVCYTSGTKICSCTSYTYFYYYGNQTFHIKFVNKKFSFIFFCFTGTYCENWDLTYTVFETTTKSTVYINNCNCGTCATSSTTDLSLQPTVQVTPSSCYSIQDFVTTSDNKKMSISSVKTGDMVKAIDSDGNIIDTEIVLIFHSHTNRESKIFG
jgi:hypothetical protein